MPRFEPAAAWRTVKVWPLAVMVAVREASVLFGAATQAMVPLPVPEPPEATVSQEALLAADHANPLDEAVTSTVPDAPSAGTLAVDGLSVIDPNAFSVSAIDEGNPRACRSAELKVAVLNAVSSSVRLMRYVPAGVNCGTVRTN